VVSAIITLNPVKMRTVFIFGLLASSVIAAAPTAAPTEECSGFKIKSDAPASSENQFTYRFFELDASLNVVKVNETGILNSHDMDHVFTICQGSNYAVQLANQGVPASCSPPQWGLTDEQGNGFFNNSCNFNQASEVYFSLESKGFNVLKNVVDFDPTSACSHDNTPKTNDSSSKGFWLHTFWGIFLIVLFCLLGLLLLFFIISACIRACKKDQEATDEERQPLVADKNNNSNRNADLKKEKSIPVAQNQKNNAAAEQPSDKPSRFQSFKDKVFKKNKVEEESKV
jgi:hypothetical protein